MKSRICIFVLGQSNAILCWHGPKSGLDPTFAVQYTPQHVEGRLRSAVYEFDAPDAAQLTYEALFAYLHTRRTATDADVEAAEELLFATSPVASQAHSVNADLGLLTGCTVLVAPFARGKTAAARYLAERTQGVFIPFGEPEGGEAYAPRVLGRLCEALVVRGATVVVIDSVRTITYERSGSSLGEGGINNAIYVDYGALSAAFVSMQRALVLTWNPLVADQTDKFNNVLTATKSSATAVYELQNVSLDGDTVLVSGQRSARELSGRRSDQPFAWRVKEINDTVMAEAPPAIRHPVVGVAEPRTSLNSAAAAALNEGN